MKHAARFSWIGMAAALFCLSARGLQAQEKGPRPDARELDESLKDVIDRGAKLYNDSNDAAGCYRIFEGALVGIRPYLETKLRAEVDAGLVKASKLPSFVDKAFELRRVLDVVRGHYQPAWFRLGGEEKVLEIAGDFLLLVMNDPKVDLDRNGKIKINVESLKVDVVTLISQVTGGPYRYSGDSLKEVHKAMKITGEEYDRTVDHLGDALKKHGVSPKDISSILTALEAMKRDVVVKAPADKKEKAAPKKPAGKEPADRGPGAIQGKVTLNGEALTGGMIAFHADEGKPQGSARIGKDGNYALVDLPPGKYFITIVAPKGAVALPARYSDRTMSGLTFRVSPGRQHLDLGLTTR